MNAIEILKKLCWSDILPDLVKVYDGHILCECLNDYSDSYVLIEGRLKGDDWYLLLRECLVDVFFFDEPKNFVARIIYMGDTYLCIEIEN